MAQRIVLALIFGAFLGVGWSANIPESSNDAQRARRFWYPPPQKPKTDKFDVVFLFDASNYGGRSGLAKAKLFAINILNLFSVFPAKTRVAAVSYNTTVNLAFDFKKHVNKECVVKDIANISYLDGVADPGAALEYVRTDLIHSNSSGARKDAEKVIFLFTTGRYKRGGTNPLLPASRLKANGVKIFAVRIPQSPRPYRHHYRRYKRYYYWTSNSFLLQRVASGWLYVLSTSSYLATYRVRRLLNLDAPKRCYSNTPVFDECGRRCKCVRGRLVECCRLRKEFLDMTTVERRRYIKTVKTVSTDPVYKPRYEALLTLHRDIFDSDIHELDFFLTWHRWYILQYENLLREIDCRITVPYWDWSLVGADPFSSDLWNPGPHGFGGDGSGRRNCVNTGPFRAEVWSLIQSSGGGCLTRDFEGRAPDAVAVKELIMQYSDPSDFIDFEFLLRTEFHDLVHCVIGGTMCTIISASAPEFFLHHGFVDKIWWDWQQLSSNHTYNEYFVTQTRPMPSTGYRSADFLELSDQPGCVCARWVPPTSSTYKSLQLVTSRQKLASIKRLPMPEMPKRAIKLFKITDKELKRLHKLLEKMKPRETIKSSSLSKKDHALGFKSSDILKKEKAHTA